MKLKSLVAALVLSSSGFAFAQNIEAQNIEESSGEDNLAQVLWSGERDQAVEMIAEDIDVNVQLSDGTSPLLYAIHSRDTALVKLLVEAGAEVNHTNDYGASTMGEAAMVGDVEMLRVLLANGGGVNLANHEGETPLMVVARAGNVAAAELLLSYGADVNARERWGGQSAAMWAAAQHQPDMLRLLTRYGADVNVHSTPRLWERRILSEPRPKDMNKGGFSPLQYAARKGCTECIEVLAAAGADLDAIDPDGVTALNLALINLHFETAVALIEAGADVNKWDLFGRAPLYNAIDLHTLPVGGRTDIPSADAHTGYDVAVMLLERGADPNMQLKLRPPYRNAIFDRGSDSVLSTGATPLMRAARAADNASVKLLLEHGALADLPNSRGETPLMVVSGVNFPTEPTRGRYKTEDDSIETIRLLLDAGADINAITGDPTVPPHLRGPLGRGEGETALHGAARKGWLKIAEYLIDNGAMQEQGNADGTTPFDLAMGRYEAGFLQAPPDPDLEMARLLQAKCMATDNCTIDDPVDFNALSQ